MKRKGLTILSLMLLVSIGLQAKTIKVLAIGNSFSEDAVENYLYELAAAQGDSLVIGNAYIGGCSIDRHLGNLKTGKTDYAFRKIVGGKKTDTKESRLDSIIVNEPWDIISLQQASPLSGQPDSYKNLGELKRMVQELATNPNVEIVWHLTWAYPQKSRSGAFKSYGSRQETMYKAIVNTAKEELPKVGIGRCIPSGITVQLAREDLGDCMNRDDIHLSLSLGRFAAACTWCEFLTGKSILYNTYWPDDVSGFDVKMIHKATHKAMKKVNKIMKAPL
jgi:hypothetical protein